MSAHMPVQPAQIADCVSVVCAHCGGDVRHAPATDAERHHGHVIDSPECWDKCGDPDVASIERAAEHLAYDIWEYERPNSGAVASAILELRKARRAFEAAGFSLRLIDGGES